MYSKFHHRLIAALVWLALTNTPVAAHEFWVAPNAYRVQPGDEVTGTLRVGQKMRGSDYPYLSHKFKTFRVTTADGAEDLAGIEGDSPALSYRADQPGLHVIAYHSQASEVTYDSWEEFLKYLRHEGLEGIEQQHKARSLPRSGFKEAYLRYAKALVQVGPLRDDDRDTPQGVPLELVALDNPYREGLKTLRLVLLRNGAPVGNHQIAVFHNDGAVSRSAVFTDRKGEAEISVASGGKFLLSATDLQPVDRGDVVWESYWASLTFGTPVDLSDLHPLDPLTSIEITRAARIIGTSGHADQETRVSLLTLAEPDKTAMLAWQRGKPFTRRAFAVVRNGAEVFEADIDLVAGEIRRWEQVPGVEPAILSAEWAMAEQLVKGDSRWIAAMRRRGFEEFGDIFCESLSAGFFDIPEERGKRLLKMPCYDRSGSQIHIYGRPIEGLISVVDLNSQEVLKVIDTGPVPVSTDRHDFGGKPGPSAQPGASHSQAGRNFQLDGRVLSWRPWSFHLGFDQRFGPVLSLVKHKDGDRNRSVLYEGHLSEIFVPYMDPDEGWYYRAYLDAGEYGLGTLASPLSAGVDCPQGATYFDASLAMPSGTPYVRERVMCVFERTTTEPLWRHWEALNGNYAGRVATELVVRAVPSVANYDYIVDWVFTEKGEIQVNIGATGIDAVKGVATRTMTEPRATEDTATGMLVAPNLVAVHHDHYFSVRLDLDVDGPVNSFVREKLVPETLPDDHPRSSLWQLKSLDTMTEGALSMRQGPELWRIENPEERTSLGHHPSYQLHGSSNATSLLDAGDWPQKRAGFSGESLWITARRAGERSAAGPYPNQGMGGTGLSSYIDGESSQQNDIVAWYTIGFHHLTRPEDWPVLPAVWHQLKLRPYGFFLKNPGEE
jgi:primary-amine oxidase